MLLKHLFSVAALALAAACDLPFGADGSGEPVRVQAQAPVLSVTNLGGRPVHYAVFERVDEGTIFWGRCSPANDGCPTLAPGETVRIPYTEIARYEEGDSEAIVYWWVLESQAEGGYGVVREGDLVVRL